MTDKHGYPNCECDLEGGDPNCDIQPPYVSLKDAYDALLAENASLKAELEVIKRDLRQELTSGQRAEEEIWEAEAELKVVKKALEQQIELLHAAAEDYGDEKVGHAVTRKALDLIVEESKFNTWETGNHPWDAQGWIEEARAALADTQRLVKEEE